MKPSLEELILGKFLSVCTPEMAFKWLADRQKEKSVYRSEFGTVLRDNEYCERILLIRNDPLIDFGLARHGWSLEVAKELYVRADHATRCAMRAFHHSGGPLEVFADTKIFSEDHMEELMALVGNPTNSDGFFEGLFQRTGLFKSLSEKQYQMLLRLAGRNKRLTTPYKSTHMDGFDEYLYHKVFDEAFQLAAKVPNTQAWAQVLWDLLGNIVRSTPSDFDVYAAIDRWRIDEVPPNPDHWYENSPSFFVRSILADLLEADDELLRSNDLALRYSFYKRFSPSRYPQWPEFVTVDTGVFFEGVNENVRIWSNWREREKLQRVAWQVPDPDHHLDAPNAFRAREAHYREHSPNFFANDDRD